jgi:hypothetical protein
MRTINQSITAPELSRTVVKLAASMVVCFSATRHRSELHAKAIMASEVRTTTRAGDISVLRAVIRLELGERIRGAPITSMNECFSKPRNCNQALIPNTSTQKHLRFGAAYSAFNPIREPGGKFVTLCQVQRRDEVGGCGLVS